MPLVHSAFLSIHARVGTCISNYYMRDSTSSVLLCVIHSMWTLHVGYFCIWRGPYLIGLLHIGVSLAKMWTLVQTSHCVINTCNYPHLPNNSQNALLLLHNLLHHWPSHGRAVDWHWARTPRHWTACWSLEAMLCLSLLQLISEYDDAIELQ